MKKELFRCGVFLTGAALLAVGTSPLLLYVLYEAVTGRSGGNPIGLGLLFFVSFWPAVILMGMGTAIAARRARTKEVTEGGGQSVKGKR